MKILMNCAAILGVVMVLFTGVETSRAETNNIVNNNLSTLLYTDVPDICIGGDLCHGDTAGYFVKFEEERYIERVSVYAHDLIGDVHQAKLELYVNGKLIDSLDVLKAGSTLDFHVNQMGSDVLLRSVHKDGASKGDETQIISVNIYGH